MTDAWDGRPPNPEQSEWYWLDLDAPNHDTPIAALWGNGAWLLPSPEGITPRGLTLALSRRGRSARCLGRCLTPPEVAGRVEAAHGGAQQELARVRKALLALLLHVEASCRRELLPPPIEAEDAREALRQAALTKDHA
jgi:hypothetical protein